MQAQVVDAESSAGGPSELEERSCPCPPNLDVHELNDPKLLRAVSKKLNIDNTKSLVAAYNATTDKTERGVLLPWLRQYTTRNEDCLRPDTVLEYAELAKLVPCTSQDELLLRDFISALCRRLHECREELLHENVAKALFSSLTWVEPSMCDEPGQLRNLATDLMSSLSSRLELTRQNFSRHEASFLAIHQVFFLLHIIGRGKMPEKNKNDLRRAVVTKRKELWRSIMHYPVKFHFELIQQAIERLETEDAPSRITRAGNRAASGLWGMAHVWHFLRELASGDINPETLKNMYMKFRNAIANAGVPHKQWYDLLQFLIGARLCALKAEPKIEFFISVYETVMKEQSEMKRKEDQKALRYGIIQEIKTLASEGSCENVRKEATTKLIELATKHADRERWNLDPDLLIALLDAVHEIHMMGECKPRTAEALRETVRLCQSHAKETLATWLGDDTMENKLQMQQRREATNRECEKVFTSIGRDVGYIPLATIRANVEELKNGYLADDFAKPNVVKHVRNMEHHVVHEEIIEKRKTERREERHREREGSEGESSTTQKRDDPREYGEQKRTATTTISIENLFKPRSLEAGVSEREIQRVLLYGNPGTGKTCIGKGIAHKWASGEMMQEFKSIYVVPISCLNVAKAGVRGETLEDMIASMCFKQKRSDAEFQYLKTQVGDDLHTSSTLLIVDGLDEANDDAKELISDAEKRSCKLLILTRPYNLQLMQARVDIQFVCLGFNDDQLENFIREELHGDEASRLMHSLQQDQGIWETARTPVTAHILCSLCKEHGTVIEDRGKKANMFRIYDYMTSFVWKRFEDELRTDVINKEIFFTDLEKIAFKALESGQIEIEEKIVIDCTTQTNHGKVMKESGFLLRTLEGCEYKFWHKTFQEFFAGRYIARCLQKESQREKRRVEKFIQEGKYIEKYILTISFAMHAFAKEWGEDALNDMFLLLDEQPVEPLGIQHLFVKMRVFEACLEGAADLKRERGLHGLDVFLRQGEARELIKSARILSMTTVDNAPIRQIVVEKFEQCSNILEKCPEVFKDIVEEVKQLLASESDLKNGEKAKIRDVLTLAEHSPIHNNGIDEWRLKLPNTDRDLCYAMEDMKRLASSKDLQDLLSTLEEEWGNKGSNVYLKAEAIGSVLELQPHELNELSMMMESRCIDRGFCMLQNVMETIGCILETMPQIASDLLLMLEIGCSDDDSDVCETARRILNGVKPEKIIPPTVESHGVNEDGLLLLFALKAFTVQPPGRSEEAAFLVHATYPQEMGIWNRRVLEQYVENFRQKFDAKFPGLSECLMQKNEQNTPGQGSRHPRI